MVDYALQRRAVLADLYAGRSTVLDVCDAHPYLQRAARYHGEPSDDTCPVCRKERLTHVSWIFGDALKHAAGSARRPEEIEQLANVYPDFSVYVVEVCRTCSWNHLVLSYVMGTADAPETSRGRSVRRRTAAE